MLYFNTKEFRKGKNLTVRRGTRWHGRKASNFNILNSEVIRFRNLKDASHKKVLKYEHDPKCRNYDGLLAEMKRIYKGFSANENVTLVFFKELGK